MDKKTNKWLVKIKLWVDTKGWWDSSPIKIFCDSKSEALKTKEEIESKLTKAMREIEPDVKIHDTVIKTSKLTAFRIRIYEPAEEK